MCERCQKSFEVVRTVAERADGRIEGRRLRFMQRAETMGVSGACREGGISRTLFYRWRQRLQGYGVDGVHPRRLRARPGPAPQVAPAVERRLLAVAIAEATWGAARLAAYAQRLWGLRVAASTLHALLRRHGLATRRHRLPLPARPQPRPPRLPP